MGAGREPADRARLSDFFFPTRLGATTIVSAAADGIFVLPGPLYHHAGNVDEQIRSEMLRRRYCGLFASGHAGNTTAGNASPTAYESLDVAVLPQVPARRHPAKQGETFLQNKERL